MNLLFSGELGSDVFGSPGFFSPSIFATGQHISPPPPELSLKPQCETGRDEDGLTATWKQFKFPTSTELYMPAQIRNGVHPINFPFQPVLHFDATNRNYHPHADQQPRIHLDPVNGFSFQSLLNAPMCNTQTRDKREKDTQNHTNSQSLIAKKDWSKEEEIALTKAWLYVSEDAEVGNNQKGAAMWDRILEAWKENMGVTCNTARNNNSLQLKWSKMQFAVSKFHAQYERLERHPQSGSNSDDPGTYIINAMRSYEDFVGAPFKFIHCWEILIKNPKWCSKELTKTAAGCKQGIEHNKPTMVNQLEDNIKDCDVISDCTKVDGLERPKGRKACKDRKRKLNEEKSVVDALTKLHCTLEKQVSINQATLEMKKENYAKELKLRGEVMQKELELKEKAQRLKEKMFIMKLKEQKRQEQDHVMNQDLSKLSPIRRAYYELRKAEILKELEDDDPCKFSLTR
ncbi:glutathione S-transferase THETA 3 [Striga asiatica]|uniref:Glutathione S-transferase THETA 3 n=1 Tax=Striga asiatica TaxID=4170 RepID=A0A5A7PUL1_STRAF|nr:glutathione S-transferase THETA 3 [Striga asiatica]